MIYFSQAGDAETSVSFDLRDRGLLLGDGVFDTALVRNGHIIFKAAHLARLKRDAAAFEIAWPEADIAAACDAVEGTGQSGALRLTLSRGPSARGVATSTGQKPTVIAHLSPFDTALQRLPLRLQTSAIRRNETSPLSRHKTLAYLDNISAAQTARQAGYDDALFVNMAGHVSCGTIGNLFVRQGAEWVTPRIEAGVIPGIIRNWILDNADRLGVPVMEADLSLEDVLASDAVFMTNSLRLLCPVKAIDARHYPADIPHTIETALKAAIEDHHD